MRKFLCFLVIALVLGSGAKLEAQEKPRQGGTLNVGIHSDLFGLNPFVRMRSIDRAVRSIAYEPLLGVDAKLQVKPYLAESWKVSPDGREYTLRLRRGVKFHNGKELAAEDVKWSADYILDARHGASGKPLLENVKAVEIVDPHTVKIVLKSPSAAFPVSLGSISTLFVVPKDSIPMGEAKVAAMPPGTGPFVFKEWRAGSHATFVRFNDYWQKGLPYLDQVVYRPVVETAARLAALRAGDLHVIVRMPSAWVLRVKKGETKDIKLVSSRSGFRRLYLNVVDPPFNNVKLRQALAYALDRKKILEGALWGIGEVTNQRFTKDSPWHFDIPMRERNPARVRELLKEAGYKGEKIVFVARQGQEEIAFIAPQLQDAGLNVAVEMLEAGTYRRRQRVGEFHMSLGGGEVYEDPHFATTEFACDEESVKRRQRDLNRTGYCNKEVDALFAQGNSTLDPKKRYGIYRKAFTAVLHDDVPEIHLAFEDRFFGVRSEVRDFASDDNENFMWLEGGLQKAWLAR